MSSSFDPVERALTAEGVVKLCDEGIARAEARASGIRALNTASDEALTWETTFGAFDDLVEAIQESISIPQLISVAHPDSNVRQAAMTCEPKVDAFASALYVDDAIASVLRRYAAKGETLSRPRARLVEHTLRDYRRNGLELDETGRESLRVLNENMTKLGQSFETNLSETTLSMEVLPEQLKGLPQSFIENHPVQENGKIRLTTDYPDLVPFLQYAEDRAAARELYTLSENRAAEKNLPILQELLILRKEKATLLGYPTWADYVLEPRMAKNAKTVKTFLDDLHVGLKPLREAEVALLLEIQKKILPEAGDRISVSNARFLEDKVASERFSLDSQALQEYFEGASVLKGIMEISSRLYGITFSPSTSPAWHEDVQVFDVKDTEGDVARIYLDLYPREGKYKHAAMFNLRETRKLPDGSRALPFAALVCNFPKPGISPALMSHDDVVTFFHEFGHLLHHILSTAELASFAGTNVARDFVEVPSQMFEEWAWHRETLDLFAHHYKTGAPLPEALFNAMTAARTFGEAIGTERQLFLATLDQTYHTREPGFDVEELVKEIYPIYSSFERIPETHFPATFGHLIGYDSAYYGYQWALALAKDVLTRFLKEGMLNQTTAADYRAAILSQGGNDEESALVERFLSRPSNTEAYLAYLGISRK